MGIPTRQDSALAELDTQHHVILTRCRTFIHAGARRDASSIKEALQAYCDAVVDFVNGAAER